MSQKERASILIVGGGIAGNSLALRWADNGFHPTLVTRTGLNPPPQVRRSAPVLNRRTAEMLTIPFNTELAAKKFRAVGTGASAFLFSHILREGIGLRGLHKNPWIAIDINATEREFHQRVMANPYITVVSGNLTDVDIEDNRITAISVQETGNERVLPADLVIDATGKTAAVAKLVESKNPGSIQETRTPQPSMVIGGYIAFSSEGLEAIFPSLENTMYAGVLRHGPAAAALFPTAYDQNSHATHLILVGGNTDAMRETYISAKSKTGKEADVSQARLEMLDMLTQDTIWNRLIQNITHLDRTIFIRYTDAVKLGIKDIKGLVLVGDAAQHLNPISAAGLSHVAQDTVRLVEVLGEAATRDEVDKSVEQFIREQSLAADRRLKAGARLYQIEHRFVEAYQKVQNWLS